MMQGSIIDTDPLPRTWRSNWVGGMLLCSVGIEICFRQCSFGAAMAKVRLSRRPARMSSPKLADERENCIKVVDTPVASPIIRSHYLHVQS